MQAFRKNIFFCNQDAGVYEVADSSPKPVATKNDACIVK